MTALSDDDINSVVCLLSDAADPTVDRDLPARKRLLADRLSALIGADIWIWSATAVNHETPGDFMTTCLIDGGWQSEAERAKVYETINSKELSGDAQLPVYDALHAGTPSTWLREELFKPGNWQRNVEIWNNLGLHGLILSFHPVSPNASSNVGFHRRVDKPDFTIREKQIVHLALQHLVWMHRHGIHQKAHEQVIRLTPRERQVLTFTLAGDSRKVIAGKMGISEYTVADYLKKLHKHFDVRSRAELQAYFFLGDQSGGLRA